MKKLGTFLSGMLTMAALVAMTTAAMAASGRVVYNQAGISLFGQTVVQAGATAKASNGRTIPSVITYVDSAGGRSHYLEIQEIAKLLDAEIVWNDDSKTIEIAPEGNQEIVVVKHGGEDEQAVKSAAPVLGQTAGPFTEIDPKSVDTSGKALIQIADNHTISNAGWSGLGIFQVKGGRHIVFTVTNNGETEQLVRIRRPITVSSRVGEEFSDVTLAPGQTLTRAFSLEEEATLLTSRLEFDVESASGFGTSDITVSLMQYQ